VLGTLHAIPETALSDNHLHWYGQQKSTAQNETNNKELNNNSYEFLNGTSAQNRSSSDI